MSMRQYILTSSPLINFAMHCNRKTENSRLAKAIEVESKYIAEEKLLNKPSSRFLDIKCFLNGRNSDSAFMHKEKIHTTNENVTFYIYILAQRSEHFLMMLLNFSAVKTKNTAKTPSHPQLTESTQMDKEK